jgi:hypothetical protein
MTGLVCLVVRWLKGTEELSGMNNKENATNLSETEGGL